MHELAFFVLMSKKYLFSSLLAHVMYILCLKRVMLGVFSFKNFYWNFKFPFTPHLFVTVRIGKSRNACTLLDWRISRETGPEKMNQITKVFSLTQC